MGVDGQVVDPFYPADVDDEGIEAGPLFELEYLRHGLRVEGIRPEAVNGLRGEGDNPSPLINNAALSTATASKPSSSSMQEYSKERRTRRDTLYIIIMLQAMESEISFAFARRIM